MTDPPTIHVTNWSSRKDAEAGACHRVWAAELLAEAGWRVVLDGREPAEWPEDPRVREFPR